MELFDVAIIGAGQAAMPLAGALARAGRRVALVERKHLGGSCVNFGCTPTKAAIASARVAHLGRRGGEFGIRIAGVESDFAAVVRRAREIAGESRQSLERSVAQLDRVTLLRGHARLAGRSDDTAGFRITLEGSGGGSGASIVAAQVVIDTGTRSQIPSLTGLADVEFLHAGNWLEREDRPHRLVIIGGGYIGLEMAQFYRRMGSEVAVIDPGEQVLHHEDRDVADAVQDALAAEGVAFHLTSRATSVERNRDRIHVNIQSDAGNATPLAGTHLFIATGRRPNTDDLGLDTVGVMLRPDGTIEADERLATGVPGIWCAGDVRGGPMFTHTSWDDYRVLASQLLGDGSRTTRGRVVPYAVFTDPQLGRVEMTEKQAREAHGSIRVARFEMKRSGKARELGEGGGFIKLVADATAQRLLGAAVFAADGAELVANYITLMNAGADGGGAPLSVIRDAIYIHPTLSEAVQSAVMAFEA